MYERTDDRIQDSSNRQGYCDEIQDEGKGQIQVNRPHHFFGKGHKMRQLPNFIVDQYNIRCIHRDVTAHTTHRDADIRHLQRRCIVDAVPDHRDRLSTLLISRNPVQLILRQAVCMDGTDSRLPRDVHRRRIVISGQQHRHNPLSLKLPNHVGTVTPHRI